MSQPSFVFGMGPENEETPGGERRGFLGNAISERRQG